MQLNQYRFACGFVVSCLAALLLGHPVLAQDGVFTIDEGDNHNILYRDGGLAAHVLVTGAGKKSRVIFSFPSENSGVGVWFDVHSSEIQFKAKGQPSVVKIADGASPALEIRFELLSKELGVRKVMLDSVRALREFNQGEFGPRLAVLTNALELIKTAPPGLRASVESRAVSRQALEAWLSAPYRKRPQDGAAVFFREAPGFKGGFHLEIVPLQGSKLVRDSAGLLRLIRTGPIAEFALRARVDFKALTPLDSQRVLNERGHACVASKGALLEDSRRNLSNLSYREKFLAGSWQYLTYFGRDTLLTLRILAPVLSKEAVAIGLAAVLDRVSDLGEVAHEEDLGDQAVYRRVENWVGAVKKTGNWESSVKMLDRIRDPIYDYKMIDGELFLPGLARAQLDSLSPGEIKVFLSSPSLRGGTYGDVLSLVCGRVARLCEPYAAAREQGQTGAQLASRLIALKPDQLVGDWRDSAEGLGGGRYPLSVNVGLASDALRSCARLRELAGQDGGGPDTAAWERLTTAWESAHEHFLVSLKPAELRERLARFFNEGGLGPDESRALQGVRVGSMTLKDFVGGEGIPAPLEKGLQFWAVALDDKAAPIPVQSSDIAFSLFDAKLDETSLRARTALFALPYPVGLATPVGVLVANASLSNRPGDYALFSRDKYHGAVIWSWPLTIVRSALERQLSRSDLGPTTRRTVREALSGVESGEASVGKLRTSELWSWRVSGDGFAPAAFGVSSSDVTESNVVQLWSNLNLAAECR